MARKRLAVVPSGCTILVIDDQDAMLTSVRMLLEHEGHTILTAPTGSIGLALFRTHPVQLVIVDYRMPEMNGESVIQALRALDARVPILLQSGDTGECDVRALLQRLDIQGFHDKGDGPDRLLRWAEHLLRLSPARSPQDRPIMSPERNWLDALTPDLFLPSALRPAYAS